MWQSTFKIGGLAGLRTTWTLGKVIFPVTLIIVILQHTPILPWLIKLIAPVMKGIGLSGDAAIPLVLGSTLNLYAGIAGIMSLDLTVKEVFIIALMMSFAHNLFIESAVAAKVGVKIWLVVAIRVGLALLAAVAVNLVWHGGGELAQYGVIPAQEELASGAAAIFMIGLKKAFLGVAQLAMIVIPLMVAIQFLKDYKWIDVFSRWMSPFTKLLGMKENTSTTMAAGLVFGLAFGAGVMIEAVKEDGVSKKDATLAIIFLVGCHAVIEDTLIFIPLGIPVWPLLVIRLFTAIGVTLLASIVWRRAHIAQERNVAS